MRVLVTPINNPEGTITKILKNFNIQLEGKKVFVKINAVDFRRGSYTSPKTIAAAIDSLYNLGADKVFVMENSTQGNFTRLVFKVTGIIDVIKEKGAKAIYLDEEKSVRVKIGEYEVDFPKVVYNIINDDSSFYLQSLRRLRP